MKTLTILAFSLGLLAQSAPDPAITAEWQRDYLVLQLAFDRANLALEAGLTTAQKKLVQDFNAVSQQLQQRQQELQAACEKKASQLALNQQGLPVCVAKPAAK